MSALQRRRTEPNHPHDAFACMPPHPASASLGHPLPVGERRLATPRLSFQRILRTGIGDPPLPDGERVAERSGGRVRGRMRNTLALDASDPPTSGRVKHAPFPPRPAVCADHLARRRRAEGRGHDREGRAGRPRGSPCPRRRSVVRAAAFGHRPAQPAGHRRLGRGPDRHARIAHRPAPAAAARQQVRALPGLRA